MKYSIFHSSQCGSTLLATLLKDSKKTYAEPPWSCEIDMYNIFSAEDDTIVKYPSFTSFVCRLLPGKKVFIFRQLQDHLEKITSKPESMKKHLSLHYNFCNDVRNLFPNLIADTDLKKLALVWAYIYLDMYFSQNVLFIDANDFFLEPIKILKKITNFYGINQVEDLEPLKFYVKKDFLGSDQILNKIKPVEKIPFNIKDAYIKSNNFIHIENWVQENIFSKINHREIFPLFRDKNGLPLYSFVPRETFNVTIN